MDNESKSNLITSKIEWDENGKILLGRFWGKYKDVQSSIDEFKKLNNDETRSIRVLEEIKNRYNELDSIYSDIQLCYRGRAELEKLGSNCAGLKTFISRLEKRVEGNHKNKELNYKYDSECSQNYEILVGACKSLLHLASNTNDWDSFKKKLNSMMEEGKKLKLKKEQRSEVFDRIDDIYKKMNERRAELKKTHEKDCDNNFSKLKPFFHNALNIATAESDFGKARKQLIEIQSMLKVNKLKNDQRDELFSRIQEAFKILSRRQEEKNKKYESDCNSNFIKLESKVNSCYNLAAQSSDFKDVREKLKSVKQELFDTSPMQKEKKSQLLSKLSDAFTKINSRAGAVFEERQRERDKKQKEWAEKQKLYEMEKERKQHEFEERKREKEIKQRQWEIEKERKQREYEERQREKERKQREWEDRKRRRW